MKGEKKMHWIHHPVIIAFLIAGIIAFIPLIIFILEYHSLNLPCLLKANTTDWNNCR